MASQGSGCMPTSGTLSGLTLVQLINAANKAFITMNSGATAPLTDCTGLSQLGQPWLDTGTNTVKQYDGASWLTWGVMDTSNHIWQPPVGGGSASVVSGSVTDVWSVAPSVVTITGTTTITSLANSSAVPGTLKFVKFAASLTLTNNAAIALPGAANIVTVAGDSALVLALTSTNVQVLTYWRNSGAALSSPSVFTGAVFFNSPLTPTALSGTTNDYNPTGLATANVIRISATGTQYLTGIVAPAGSFDIAHDALLRRTHSPAFVVGFVGTNDLANGVTAVTLRAATEAYAAAVQALGWKYVACTIPPRTLDTDGIAPWPAGKEAQRVAYNAGLVSDHAFAQGGLVDVDAINPTRQGDGLHLASAGAAAVATGASGVKAVIDPQI